MDYLLKEVDSRRIGRDVDEALTEVITLKFGARNPGEKKFIRVDAGYSNLTNKLLKFMEFISRKSGMGENELIEALLKAKINGTPGAFIKWIKDKTGLKINPKDFLELNLEKYEAD